MGDEMSSAAFGAFVFLLLRLSRAEVLEPPEFNLATGKVIQATSTCGLDEDNNPIIEGYCFIGGSHSDTDTDVYINNGQYCSVCDQSRPDKWHPATNAIDGTGNWWMSPPLSRGIKYNKVNLTIDLGREFHVAYITVTMAISPRPGVWILEKSTDYGKTYEPWQYFADSAPHCEQYFNVDESTEPTADDSVLCVTEFSKVVPMNGGEIIIPLLKGRPSAKDFSNSTALQKWTKATNVRLHFIRTKTLLGHLMSLAQQDPTVTRRYFYAIKQISIGGKCVCNGHADECSQEDPNNRYRLLCKCQHNTYGINCQKCRDGFVQKPWRPSKTYDPFVCEPCNCFGHSDKCEYDAMVDKMKLSLDIHGNYEGGGVCRHCKHNTDGINCNKCKPRFYRPHNRPLNATDVCEKCNCTEKSTTGNCYDGDGNCECRPEYQPPLCKSCSPGYFGYPKCNPCKCNPNRTEKSHCSAEGGHCFCKPNYTGRLCDSCADGFYNFPDCLPCSCSSDGAANNKCDQTTGNCNCKKYFGGKLCDKCLNGYYKFPNCTKCNCNKKGTLDEICNKKTGHCLCKEEYRGMKCDRCVEGKYSYPTCISCGCSNRGSKSIACNDSGQCPCHSNYDGKMCDHCNAGYYQYPDCLDCKCDLSGSEGKSCDEDGMCNCRSNFTGIHCNKCKQGFFNFPDCEACNCDPKGVKDSESGCELLPTGELCPCKKHVTGQICNECKPNYWNIQASNPDGCEDCDCNLSGVVGSIGECNSVTGQCNCKLFVDSPKCKECKNGTFNLLDENIIGCTDCDCDVGGSVNNICDKKSGQCLCKPNIEGRTCSKPIDGYYFPTLYQLKFEAEDGRRLNDPTLHFDFNENLFPNSSYAVFSEVQDEIFLDIKIRNSSVYHMIFHYVNLDKNAVAGKVEIIPHDGSMEKYSYEVFFKPSKKPAFVTVTGRTANYQSSTVMDPGKWSVRIKSKKGILLDYVVIMPSDFYEANILTKKVDNPCLTDEDNKEKYTFCRHLEYLNISSFDKSQEKELKKKSAASFLGALGGLFAKSEPEQDEKKEEKEGHQLQINISKSGKYVLIVVYQNPLESGHVSLLTIEATSEEGTLKGKFTIYPCNFATSCRQVVQDGQGSIVVFEFKKSTIKLKIQEDEKTKVVTKSVVAIPYDKWSFDYIQPKSVCVMMDGKCMLTTFSQIPDSKKVEFETSSKYKRTKKFPNGIYDDKIGLIYLDSKDEIVDVKGKVSAKGRYVFMVHYYQPDYSGFVMDAMIYNGRIHEAYLDILYCPSTFGCRSFIHDADGNIFFGITDAFVLNLKKQKHKTIWLDYINVIPADMYKEHFLKEDDIDQTALFKNECGKNEFDISTDSQGFCSKSVFSITSNYNNGTLPCECNAEGSFSSTCKTFGGQCSCKSNIIGRKCDICKPGFFGFPKCAPCNCPYRLSCDSNTGACRCPSRVTGAQCDRCDDYSYAFNETFGCKECGCHSKGVEKGNLQCDKITGECNCKENFEGRTCNHCSPGYSSFPSCKLCGCDLKGTKPGICDEVTAKCFCKKNVMGKECGVCKKGTFNIDIKNPNGCTKCYCSGKTTNCTSSTLYKTEVSQMQGWNLAEVKVKERWFSSYEASIKNISVVPTVSNNVVHADLTTKEVAKKIVYFTAPDIYLGNKLISYGGFLNYTITHSPQGSSERFVNEADVIFLGSNVLMYQLKKLLEAEKAYQISIKMTEENFKLPGGSLATREQILEVFKDLKGLYIAATYSLPSSYAKLSKVIMESADENHYPGAQKALSVEKCNCPSNFKGLSCEACVPGYFRSKNGNCIPCICNGHADDCDPQTGICMNCKHNTIGNHCEKCEKGYYGNATNSKPDACVKCACPLQMPSNNFAEDCQLNPDGKSIKCSCPPQYKGDQCEKCAPGYYGKPKIKGNECKPCECSGNINPDDHGSCDPVTGVCLKCLNNTSGYDCSKCAQGYYGDAVNEKNCKRCKCNQCGTSSCDGETGDCKCKVNVIGDKCDQCAANHWKFFSCEECLPCGCQPASKSMQCDIKTGQCICQPGVTGLTCDRCDAGFWNYTSSGCISCGCNKEYSNRTTCNPDTGKCDCLSGLIGDKCDHCPSRFVLVPYEGCFECDICIHILLNETDYLDEMAASIEWEFANVAVSRLTNQRLNYINNTTTRLIPKVKSLHYDTKPLIEDIERLKEPARKTHQLAMNMLEKSIRTNKEGKDGLLNALGVETMVNEDIEEARKIVKEITAFNSDILEYGSPAEYAYSEAQKLLEQIKGINFRPSQKNALQVLEEAQEKLKKARGFSDSVMHLTEKLAVIHGGINILSNKLTNLDNYTQNSIKNIKETKLLNEDTRLTQIAKNIEVGMNDFKAINVSLKEAKVYLENAKEIDLKIKSMNITLLKHSSDLVELRNKVNASIHLREKALEGEKGIVEMAIAHSEKLTERAQGISKNFADTRNASEKAILAANSYNKIIEAIGEAKKSAKVAERATIKTLEMSRDFWEHTGKSDARSSEALRDAKAVLNNTQVLLMPNLKMAQKNLVEVKDLNKNSEEEAKKMSNILENIKQEQVKELVKNASIDAEESVKISKDVLHSISDIVKNAPLHLIEAKDISNVLTDAKANVSQAGLEVEKSKSKLPDLDDKSNQIKEIQSHRLANFKNIEKEIAKLRKNISIAIDEINRISFGATLFGNSTIVLKNPKDLSQINTSGNISMHFRTNENNGFLFYLGNEIGTKNRLKRFRSDDFVALEIEHGFPVLKIDLGSGTETIRSKKFVADGKWYQFIIDRTGKIVRLIIYEKSKNLEIYHEEKMVLSGVFSVLDLDQNLSKLFIGGYPTTYNMQPEVKYSAFVGGVEELFIGNNLISLWNFEEAQNIDGVKERNNKDDLDTKKGLKFDGSGYVTFKGNPCKTIKQCTVVFEFKTTAKDGLLFLVKNSHSFLSIEMAKGSILFQFDLGDGRAVLNSESTYNDGKWHIVEAGRSESMAILKVDNEEKANGSSPGSATSLIVSKMMYFGGFPQEHHLKNVTNRAFAGCIDKEGIEWEKYFTAFGISYGCSEKLVNIASFRENSPDFIRLPNITANNYLQLTFKFNTTQENGLLFYATDASQWNTLSLSLTNGSLVTYGPKGRLRTTSKTNAMKYNDGKWHAVVATLNRNILTLHIDDYFIYKYKPFSTTLTIENGNIYFGGVPEGYDIDKNAAPHQISFTGCIGDITVNEKVIKFKEMAISPFNILGECNTDRYSAVVSPAEKYQLLEFHQGKHSVHTKAECALPLVPGIESHLNATNGYRFGTQPQSYLEYFAENIRIKHNISVEFNTDKDNGVIFYAAGRHSLALFLKDGKLYYAFHCNDRVTVIKTKYKLNDGQWHSAALSRHSPMAKLFVDNMLVNEVPTTCKTLKIHNSYFLGGISSRFAHEAKNNLEVQPRSFSGCIRNLQFSGDKIDQHNDIEGVIPCSDKVEPGVFFTVDAAFIRIADNFTVGKAIDIEMSIKPRKLEGLLLSVHGKKDFLVLQMHKGKIIFTVNNGKSSISTEYKPLDENLFCDGKWHHIKATKIKNVVFLFVDGEQRDMKMSHDGTSDTHTSNPLFLGGVADISSSRNGIKTQESFVGCIRNLTINNKIINLIDKKSIGKGDNTFRESASHFYRVNICNWLNRWKRIEIRSTSTLASIF